MHNYHKQDFSLGQGCKNVVMHSHNQELEALFCCFLHFVLYACKCCMAKLVCVRYNKFLCSTSIHRRFCIPG